MDMQRLAALLVFTGILLVGLVAAAVIRSSVKARRLQRESEELEAFLTDLSSDGDDKNLAGAPAVMFKQENESTYSDEPVKAANIFIHTGDYPDPREMRRVMESRRLLEQRRRLVQEIVKNKLQTMSRGALVIDGKPLLIRNLRIEDQSAQADLTTSAGTKVGVMALTSKDGKIIQGQIQINQDGERVKYDVLIPVDHPNVSRLYGVVNSARPTNVVAAIQTVRASYNATPLKSLNATAVAIGR